MKPELPLFIQLLRKLCLASNRAVIAAKEGNNDAVFDHLYEVSRAKDALEQWYWSTRSE